MANDLTLPEAVFLSRCDSNRLNVSGYDLLLGYPSLHTLSIHRSHTTINSQCCRKLSIKLPRMGIVGSDRSGMCHLTTGLGIRGGKRASR